MEQFVTWTNIERLQKDLAKARDPAEKLAISVLLPDLRIRLREAAAHASRRTVQPRRRIDGVAGLQ